MRGRSFYYCISENCLPDAVKCLENAKGNNSIAYLRFWFRDPRLDDEPGAMDNPSDDSDEEMTTDTSVDQDVGGGVQLDGVHHSSNVVSSDRTMDLDGRPGSNSRTSSGLSAVPPHSTHEAIFGNARAAESSTSSIPLSPEERSRSRQEAIETTFEPIEIEAVISCTSDGLVVCLRRARPIIPTRNQGPYENGLFAAPWALEPVLPRMETRPQPAHTNNNFAPALGPQYAQARDHLTASGPDHDDFMDSIREQAVFAWALTGINGSLHRFGYGKPTGESVPQNGFPVWESDPHIDLTRSDSGPTNFNATGKAFGREKDIFGDPGLGRKSASSSGGSVSRSLDGEAYAR